MHLQLVEHAATPIQQQLAHRIMLVQTDISPEALMLQLQPAQM
jgi:hypothetical protein